MYFLLLLSLLSTVTYTSAVQPVHMVVTEPVPVVVTQPESEDPSALIIGYIEIDGNVLYVDDVEVIMLDNRDRMMELGLTDEDLPNGYFIYNPNIEKNTYELTADTIYTFTDYHLLYIEEADGDRIYRTTEIEHFMNHLNTSYSDQPPASKVPFFIEVKEGEVVSITEEFQFTQ